MRFSVNYKTTLFDFLNKTISNKSKNVIKSLLSNENILVNGKLIKRHDYILNIGDTVEILKKISRNIDIVYEDKFIIAVNKPSGLLTISTEKETDKTLYKYVSDYVKTVNKNSKIFVVHRLDKDTSGIVLFAKNKETKEKLQHNWNDNVSRKYYAVVTGKLDKKRGTIKSYIKENKAHKSFSSNSGDLAITNYKVIKENKNYSLLDIEIKTGRKNQIRVQFSDMGNQIVGDKKYGFKNNQLDRLALHAYSLSFKEKINGKNYDIKTPIPRSFNKLININDIKIL